MATFEDYTMLEYAMALLICFVNLVLALFCLGVVYFECGFPNHLLLSVGTRLVELLYAAFNLVAVIHL